MNYDESIKKAEQIIAQLEQAEALSMDEYKRLAAEATALLKECKSHIEGLEKTLQ
ncbi:MAG: exodeoxyribonuclease VII small subunit [Paludibacteraceae bacterium]|nr:exodeoxyribonuclease VII small subunit [Paludibacteraceae bacterium]MBR6493247.1 exodeoxyribonuclease VII small subunit [Paludibacteraceae bacterium]